MCGICGKVDWESCVDAGMVRRMMDTLVHRGPDDEGLYIEPCVVLGHRRLAIIDLKAGRQPLSNEDGRVWVVFNGEIYNFRELREHLVEAGHRFKTQTDTEVIVHLYEQYGETCVGKLKDMFAFAVWDSREKKLLLARDRLGIKPLYYAVTPTGVSFASEVKALLEDPAAPRSVDPQVIDRFLTCLYLPGLETLLRRIRKLQPRQYLVVEEGKVRTEKYWDLPLPLEAVKRSPDEVESELIELLDSTVRAHMVSDVPIAVLLSGGVDSPGILSLCISDTQARVDTFTIGFTADGLVDEREYARLLSKRYGTIYKVRGLSTTIYPEKSPEGSSAGRDPEAKKTGFPVPFKAWIQDELKDYSRDVLLDGKTLASWYFSRVAVGPFF